jgi:hypothetical protein
MRASFARSVLMNEARRRGRSEMRKHAGMAVASGIEAAGLGEDRS